MEKLSYLATFVSLIYGLGVANVLAHIRIFIIEKPMAIWVIPYASELLVREPAEGVRSRARETSAHAEPDMYKRSNNFGRSIPVLTLIMIGWLGSASAAIQDEIFGDNFEGFDHAACDTGLPSNSTDPLQYAAALDLCQTTTEPGTAPGVISGTFTLSSGTGTPAAQSHAIRSAFGSGNSPRFGSAMAVLSTGAAAATGQTLPSFTAFQPGSSNGTSSAAPADWLTANGGTIPSAPGCPTASGTAAQDPVMLTLRIRVPGNARSFSLAANFFSSDYPESVCGQFNDVFVALLDSGFAGAPANPVDKNLATYIAPNSAAYPLGVNLAYGNTGLFTQCVNGATGCASGNPSTIYTCTSTSGLTGTGMDIAAPADSCGVSGGMVGGGTDWLMLRGNVIPGEIITLRLALWDSGDSSYDSLVILDNFQWSSQLVTAGTTRN